MKIRKKSKATGKVHTMDIPNLTYEQWQHFKVKQQAGGPGTYIQDLLPHLTLDEREFIISGTTAEEWQTLFGDDDEKEVRVVEGKGLDVIFSRARSKKKQ